MNSDKLNLLTSKQILSKNIYILITYLTANSVLVSTKLINIIILPIISYNNV